MKKFIALSSLTILLSFTPFQNPKPIKIELTVPQVETVIKALQKMPYEESAPVINSIIEQANKQLRDTTKPKK